MTALVITFTNALRMTLPKPNSGSSPFLPSTFYSPYSSLLTLPAFLILPSFFFPSTFAPSDSSLLHISLLPPSLLIRPPLPSFPLPPSLPPVPPSPLILFHFHPSSVFCAPLFAHFLVLSFLFLPLLQISHLSIFFYLHPTLPFIGAPLLTSLRLELASLSRFFFFFSVP